MNEWLNDWMNDWINILSEQSVPLKPDLHTQLPFVGSQESVLFFGHEQRRRQFKP